MIYEALRPGAIELFDVSLPRSEIPGHVRRVHELEREHGIPLPTYGHAADGNVHTQSMRGAIEDGVLGAEIDGLAGAARGGAGGDLRRRDRPRAASSRASTASAWSRRTSSRSNVGDGAVAAMRAIKRALDPKGILNPGKIFDLERHA